MATRKAKAGTSVPAKKPVPRASPKKPASKPIKDEAAALAAKALNHRSDGRYKIIRGTDMLDLADAMNRNAENGWVLVGGLALSPTNPMDMQSVPHPYHVIMEFKP